MGDNPMAPASPAPVDREALWRTFSRSVAVAAIGLSIALGIITGIMLFVIPQFARVFGDMRLELPWSTQSLLCASELGPVFWIPLTLLPLTVFLPAVRRRGHAWAATAHESEVSRRVEIIPAATELLLIAFMFLAMAWIVYSLFVPRVCTFTIVK